MQSSRREEFDICIATWKNGSVITLQNKTKTEKKNEKDEEEEGCLWQALVIEKTNVLYTKLFIVDFYN